MERRVLRLRAQGKPLKAIARALGQKPRTTDAHLRSLHRKLGVSCAVELANKARQFGLVDAD